MPDGAFTGLPVPHPEQRAYRLSGRHPEFFAVYGTRGAVSIGTSRMLGIWVPASAFRRGTRIVMELMHTNSASPSYQIGIGGNGSAVALGVVATLAPPAGATGSYMTGELQQETDGIIATFRQTGARVAAGASGNNATATITAFIQPWNFVEIRPTTTMTITKGSLMVIPGAGYQKGMPYQQREEV